MSYIDVFKTWIKENELEKEVLRDKLNLLWELSEEYPIYKILSLEEKQEIETLIDAMGV
jgi:muconolactone delta-isomerase